MESAAKHSHTPPLISLISLVRLASLRVPRDVPPRRRSPSARQPLACTHHPLASTPDAGLHVCDSTNTNRLQARRRAAPGLGPEDEVRAAAASDSSGHHAHHHHLPTLGHLTARHSASSTTPSNSALTSHSTLTPSNHQDGEDDISADWMPDAGPWPVVFHAAFFAQVWCTYRAGSETIRDLPGLGALPAVGVIPTWEGAGALTSTHENGEHAGESSGHTPPPGMSHGPSPSDSSYTS
ncbi:hypothetical protein DFH09DRAFT_272486 [Mycena vulgaris]|nr:hypothetical protein DFH09DRAFT_272486 [Mycena vulgaris]